MRLRFFPINFHGCISFSFHFICISVITQTIEFILQSSQTWFFIINFFLSETLLRFFIGNRISKLFISQTNLKKVGMIFSFWHLTKKLISSLASPNLLSTLFKFTNCYQNLPTISFPSYRWNWLIPTKS